MKINYPAHQLSGQKFRRALLAFAFTVSSAGVILSSLGGEALANTWKLPFRGSANVNGAYPWHGDGYGLQALDLGLSPGSDVLAPTDATVVSQCNAGNNHRAIKLQATDGRFFSLIHVQTGDIFVGKTYKQGDVVGKVAGDTPWNSCAQSTGAHLHFGSGQNNTIDGYYFNGSFPSGGTRLTSTNGGNSNSNINNVNFSATAAPGGVNIRSGPGTSFSIVGRLASNQRVSFDAWQFGQVVNDLWTGTPDARWYRIAGTNNWVASAVVNGNAPGSRPMP